MENLKANSVHKIYCPHCEIEQQSEVQSSINNSDHYDDSDITVYSDYYIMKCLGGNHSFFYLEYYNSEEYHFEYEFGINQEVMVFEKQRLYYPAKDRPINLPTWFGKVEKWDETLYKLIIEVKEAENKELYRLATGGLRTIFDCIVEKARNGDSSGSFNEKMQFICGKLNIKKHDKEPLKILLDAGHSAIHRAWTPDSEQFVALWNILSDLLHRIVVVDTISDSLPART